MRQPPTTPALRRRLGARIAVLEQQVEERRERVTALAEEAADAPPTAADLGAALDRLPMIAERLPHLPQPEMRALLDSLHLQLAYQPAVQAVDVELSLLVDETPDRRGAVAEVWSVHLALHNTNLNPLVEGPALMLAPVHGKVRRAGYHKAGAT